MLSEGKTMKRKAVIDTGTCYVVEIRPGYGRFYNKETLKPGIGMWGDEILIDSILAHTGRAYGSCTVEFDAVDDKPPY
jgi:hypothetical protein